MVYKLFNLTGRKRKRDGNGLFEKMEKEQMERDKQHNGGMSKI